MLNILIVEDDPIIAELIAINLEHAGYRYTAVETPEAAIREVDTLLPDLVLLDWMLPNKSGIALTKQWRSNDRTRQLPIIMLTARSEELDKIQGLDAGADDYIIKPFSTQELLARIRALLRRKTPELTEAELVCGELTLNSALWQVIYKEKLIKLGSREFKLLKYLMHYPNRVHSRVQLLDKVWGEQAFIEERTVDVHIKRLREAMAQVKADHYIETVRGVGYRFNSKADGCS